MITEASGDEFTKLIYRAAAESSLVDKILPLGPGPSTQCSFIALLDKQGGMTLAQLRHLRECPFCARLAACINRSEIAADAPP